MKPFRHWIAVTLTSFGLVACGDDGKQTDDLDVTPPEDLVYVTAAGTGSSSRVHVFDADTYEARGSFEVPQGATEAHLKHLAAIAEMFSDESFCSAARAANDDAALFKLISDYQPA